MSDPYSRAFSMINDIECGKCGEVPQQGKPRLHPSNKQNIVFEANYECTCGVEYFIEIEDDEMGLTAIIERTDTGSVREIATTDSKLNRDSHSAKEEINALYDLQDALDMLHVNWARVRYISENLPDFPGDIPPMNDRRFHAQVFTEIHNYLATAYTFQETYNTAIQKLPRGEIIDSKFQDFKEETRVVIGLRTYVQHEQIFGMNISPDLNRNEYRIDFKVEVDDVWKMESKVTDDNIYGYDDHPEEIYGDIEGKYIDIRSEFKNHLNASQKLVEIVNNYANEEMGEELNEFTQSLDFHHNS